MSAYFSLLCYRDTLGTAADVAFGCAQDGIEFFVTVVVRKPQDNRRPLKDLFGQAGHYVMTYYPPSHLRTILPQLSRNA